MLLQLFVAVQVRLTERLRPKAPTQTGARCHGDAGQATAEYALVIVGAAAVALLLIAWATGSGKIASLLDTMVDRVADMVT